MTIRLTILLCLLGWMDHAHAQSVPPYPDEAGFRQRVAPILEQLARRDIRPYAQAASRAPDADEVVYNWALAGDTIFDPLTGRAFAQGPTGYFGPKRRDTAGRITAFGGDGLKYSLPPLTARLLRDANDPAARAWLTIPGNLRQQYHFAAVNWTRLLPLLGEQLPSDWHDSLALYVGQYRQSIHSNNQGSTGIPLTAAHDLIGEAGQLLGGNDIDGGTENHKVMWRTSGLVYADWLPAGSLISGYPLDGAHRYLSATLRDFTRRLYTTGNGEYDSSIYYPYSIDGLLNVYDFARDTLDREMARAALDYYLLTAAVKSFDGRMAGVQKRGYLPGQKAGRMEAIYAAYFGEPNPEEARQGTIHLATTTYRPNALITRVGRGEYPMPLDLRISRPSYHLDRANAFQESYYRTPTFALGNVYQSLLDNPNQQLLWSLTLRTSAGVRGLTGGQPRRLSTSGHSPYTQTLHHRGTLLLLAADTEVGGDSPLLEVLHPRRVNPWYAADSLHTADRERGQRTHFGQNPLVTVSRPDPQRPAELDRFYADKEDAAASWLLLPKELRDEGKADGIHLFSGPECWVIVRPLGESYQLAVATSVIEEVKSKKWREMLSDYRILVVPGRVSGYVLEVVDRANYHDRATLLDALGRTKLRQHGLRLRYTNLAGDRMEMRYQPDGLRAAGRINGKPLDYARWTPPGTTYSSGLLTTGGGRLDLRLPDARWRVDYRGDRPEYHYRTDSLTSDQP